MLGCMKIWLNLADGRSAGSVAVAVAVAVAAGVLWWR